MYQLIYKASGSETVIYDPRSDDRKLISSDVSLIAGEPGSMTFTIAHDHPAVAVLTELAGVVELKEDGDIIYRGRIIRISNDFNNSKTVETEGLLAALNDTVAPPFSFPADCINDPAYIAAAASGNVVAYMLGVIITNHNNQVDADRQITLGNVTVTDPNNYIARSSTEYLTSWEVINSKLVASTLGGFVMPRYANGVTYIDYLAAFTTASAQPVQFARNLIDYQNEKNAATICTAIMPIGSGGLTIAGIPDGTVATGYVKSGNIVYSVSGRSRYGKITKVVHFDDVTVANNLVTKALRELATDENPETTISVVACDLHYEDGTIPSFRLGNVITVKSTPHGMNSAYALTEIAPDIMNPANTQITLGAIIRPASELNNVNVGIGRTVIAQQSEIDEAKQDIMELEQTAQGLSVRVQSAEDDINTLEVTAQGLSTRMTTAEGDIGELEVTAQGLTSRMENAEGDITTLEQTTEGIVLRAEKLGGDNLLVNSGFDVQSVSDATTGWTLTGSGMSMVNYTQTGNTFYAARIIGALQQETLINQNIINVLDTSVNATNQIYTVSCEAYCSRDYTEGATNPLVALYFSGTNASDQWLGATLVSGNAYFKSIKGQGWQKMTYTVRFASVPKTMRFYIRARDFTGQICFRHIKMEKGYTATDYSIGARQTSTIEQTANKIYFVVGNDATSSSITINPAFIAAETPLLRVAGILSVDDVSSGGSTVIDGARISTGTVSADRLDVTGIFAKNVTATGTISGAKIKTDAQGGVKAFLQNGSLTFVNASTDAVLAQLYLSSVSDSLRIGTVASILATQADMSVKSLELASTGESKGLIRSLFSSTSSWWSTSTAKTLANKGQAIIITLRVQGVKLANATITLDEMATSQSAANTYTVAYGSDYIDFKVWRTSSSSREVNILGSAKSTNAGGIIRVQSLM